MTAPAAGRVLGRAFVDDPVRQWLVRGRQRERRLTHAFSAFAATAARTPGVQVLVTPEQSAAALWLPPGRWRATVSELLRTGPQSLAGLRAGVLRGLRLQAVVERHGFARGEPLPVPAGCPPMVAFRREPR